MENKEKRNIDIDDHELESFTNSAVEHLHDNDLKNKYSKILSDTYDIDRSTNEPTKRITILKKMVAIFIVVIFSWVIIQSYSNNTVEELAKNYAHSTSFLSNQSILRSTSNELLKLRADANKDFIEKRYEMAIDKYKKMELSSIKLNTIDHFYLGISYLKAQSPNAQNAILYLEKIGNSNGLATEAQWMLSLAYILNGDKTKAQQLLDQMLESSTYKQKEAQLLLDQLN